MSTTDDPMRRLHDSLTRGAQLSPDDQARLDRWYEEQDREEQQVLGQASSPPTIAVLRAEVAAAVAQLLVVSQHIQALTVENEAARRTVADLQEQLARSSRKQPA